MNISINIKKTSDEITPQLKRMSDALGSSGQSQILSSMADKFVNMAKSTFGSGNTKYRGNNWKPYSKAYAKKVGGKEATLFRTGGLKNSIYASNPQGNSITVYSDHKLAYVHFFGSKNGIPGRRFAPVSGAPGNWILARNAQEELSKEILINAQKLSGGALPN